MSSLLLEIVEGPSAGQQIALDRAIVVGRGDDADLVLPDSQVSRHHARITPSGEAAIIEDLDSANGTFIDHNQLDGPARLDIGEDLLIGVTVIQLRTAIAAAKVSAVRPVPPGLAKAPATPDFVPAAVAAETRQSAQPASIASFLDVRVKRQAQTAPVAILVLAALIGIIYLASR